MSTEPAFPLHELDKSANHIVAQHFGLTVCDYFAAKAMQGLLAQSMGTALGSPVEEAAAYAYAMADAMLAERQRRQTTGAPT